MLWANTHCRFRHLGIGSPYIYYVNLEPLKRLKASQLTPLALLASFSRHALSLLVPASCRAVASSLSSAPASRWGTNLLPVAEQKPLGHVVERPLPSLIPALLKPWAG